MKIAEARRRTSKSWRTHDITWEQFLNRLREPLRTGETVREYQTMDKESRDRAKEAAGGFVAGALSGRQRKKEAVLSRSMITLDADHARPDSWERATLLMEQRMCCYSTHSHTPAAPRLRWVIPTDRPMTPDEYPAVARRVADWLGIGEMDPSTYEIARLMYFPTCPLDGDYVFHEQAGPVLSVDEVLSTYGDGEAWKDASLWPCAESERAVLARAQQRAGEPTEKAGIVGLFCRAYDVPAAIDAFLQDCYEPAGEDRYTYLKGSTAAGAVLYDGGAFLYSNHATDPAGGRSCNAFDLVRIHLFSQYDDAEEGDVPVTKLPSYKKMCDFCASLPAVKDQILAERKAAADRDFGDLIGAREAAAAEPDGSETLAAAKPGIQEGSASPDAGAAKRPEATERRWQDALTVSSKTGIPEATIDNALLILRNDPLLAGRFGLSDFDDRRYVRDRMPWEDQNGRRAYPDLWVDSDDSGLRLYFSKVWGIIGKNIIDDALQVAELRNRFHPVRDYLNSLSWDGVERLDSMLIRHMKAEDTPLTRAMTRKWMVAACKRVFEPGCKFDTMLVLISPTQGSGKSMVGDTLAGPWFKDGIKNVDQKDAMQDLRGKWIVEMGEMAATRKSTNESIKQFIACRRDAYRPSYGRYTRDFPRQCVFIGSTNCEEFILDETGGRRFWPVDVSAAKPGDSADRIRGLKAERDQLWAEAMYRYRQGETLYLEGDLLLESLRAQAHHTQDDEWLGMLQDYLDKPLPDGWDRMSPEARRDYIQGTSLTTYQDCTKRRDTITIAEIRFELLGEALTRGAGGNNESSRHLGRIMNVLPGWQRKKTKVSTPFGRQKAYERISE